MHTLTTATDPKKATWKVDETVDMGYLKITDEPVAFTRCELGVNVDYDRFDRVVGVEVFL